MDRICHWCQKEVVSEGECWSDVFSGVSIMLLTLVASKRLKKLCYLSCHVRAFWFSLSWSNPINYDYEISWDMFVQYWCTYSCSWKCFGSLFWKVGCNYSVNKIILVTWRGPHLLILKSYDLWCRWRVYLHMVYQYLVFF